MKIAVTPEGREDIYLPDRGSLRVWIQAQGFEQIHNFVPTGSMILGADHSVESVLDDIDKAERVALMIGPMRAHNMGHALALIANNRLEMYDIGEVTLDDLEVTVDA